MPLWDWIKGPPPGYVRLSFGPETTEGDIDALYEALLRHKNTRFSML